MSRRDGNFGLRASQQNACFQQALVSQASKSLGLFSKGFQRIRAPFSKEPGAWGWMLTCRVLLLSLRQWGTQWHWARAASQEVHKSLPEALSRWYRGLKWQLRFPEKLPMEHRQTDSVEDSARKLSNLENTFVNKHGWRIYLNVWL